jgi:hypothetical protein
MLGCHYENKPKTKPENNASLPVNIFENAIST